MILSCVTPPKTEEHLFEIVSWEKRKNGASPHACLNCCEGLLRGAVFPEHAFHDMVTIDSFWKAVALESYVNI